MIIALSLRSGSDEPRLSVLVLMLISRTNRSKSRRITQKGNKPHQLTTAPVPPFGLEYLPQSCKTHDRHVFNAQDTGLARIPVQSSQLSKRCSFYLSYLHRECCTPQSESRKQASNCPVSYREVRLATKTQRTIVEGHYLGTSIVSWRQD